ncbi:MAG TPA: hypothetical protein VJS18_22275, partial [Paraburkholderia sp.]|nr:hypothetical protein [Paraburkholderia sp.]
MIRSICGFSLYWRGGVALSFDSRRFYRRQNDAASGVAGVHAKTSRERDRAIVLRGIVVEARERSVRSAIFKTSVRALYLLPYRPGSAIPSLYCWL